MDKLTPEELRVLGLYKDCVSHFADAKQKMGALKELGEGVGLPPKLLALMVHEVMAMSMTQGDTPQEALERTWPYISGILVGMRLRGELAESGDIPSPTAPSRRVDSVRDVTDGITAITDALEARGLSVNGAADGVDSIEEWCRLARISPRALAEITGRVMVDTETASGVAEEGMEPQFVFGSGWAQGFLYGVSYARRGLIFGHGEAP